MHSNFLSDLVPFSLSHHPIPSVILSPSSPLTVYSASDVIFSYLDSSTIDHRPKESVSQLPTYISGTGRTEFLSSLREYLLQVHWSDSITATTYHVYTVRKLPLQRVMCWELGGLSVPRFLHKIPDRLLTSGHQLSPVTLTP